MGAISIDVAGLEGLNRALRGRVNDLERAADIVRPVRSHPAVNSSDPSVRAVPPDLAAIDRRLGTVRSAVDAQQRGVEQFLTAASSLDRRGALRGLGLVPPAALLARLGRAVARPACDTVVAGLRSVGFALRSFVLRPVVRASTMVLRRSGRFVVRAGSALGRRARDAVTRYVIDPLGRLKRWIAAGWRTITGAFRSFWDAAWARFQTVVACLRTIARGTIRAGKAVVAAGQKAVKLGRLVLGRGARAFTTEFPDAPPKGDNVLIEETYTGTVEVDIPLGTVDLRLRSDLAVKVEHYDNDTVEITLSQELAAGIAKSLEGSGLAPGDKAKVEAAVMLALKTERTYRIENTLIDGVPAHVVFIEQQVARIVLQALVASGVGPLALAILNRMPPEPSPVKTAVAVSVEAEVELDVSLGGNGVKASGELELEGRLELNDDGTSVWEVSAEVEVSGEMTVGGAGDVATSERKVTFRVTLDDKGLPVRIEAILVGTEERGLTGGVDAPAVDAGASAVAGVRQTVTAVTEVSAAERARLASIVDRLPGSAGELLRELGSYRVDDVDVDVDTYVETTAEVGFDAGVVDVSLEHEQRVYGPSISTGDRS